MMNLPDPIGEPITLEEARKQCSIDAVGSPPTHPLDSHFTDIWIPAAREYAEHYLGAVIGQREIQVVRDTLDAAGFALDIGPVLGIASITYLDTDGADQTVDYNLYDVNRFVTPERVYLTPNAVWPEVGTGFTNPVRVNYVIGYSTPGESPQDKPLPRAVKTAMLLLIGHLYKNREASVDMALQTLPLGVNAFLDTVRVRKGFA